MDRVYKNIVRTNFHSPISYKELAQLINTLTDEQLIEGMINDEVKPELVEEITDVNKLYSKKIIESKGNPH